MEKIYLICVDDQREVLSAVIQDLSTLEPLFLLEACESGEECLALMEELDARGDRVALVISDHIMPGQSGVELLTRIAEDHRFDGTRKILLTGQASHQDTIEAVNQARIDHYLEKPWPPEELLAVCRQLLTEYLFAQGIDYEPYIQALDQDTLYRLLK